MIKISRIIIIAVFATMLSACGLFAPQPVWIDVRSVAEYEEDHIDNTEHIVHTDMAAQISDLDLDLDTPIKLFCRSGVRAGIALTTLEGLGYTNVENVGGIADAREVRNN